MNRPSCGEIFNFCCQHISREKYRAKRFGEAGLIGRMANFERSAQTGHATKPLPCPLCVSRQNNGETAFQRALKGHREGFRYNENRLTWLDIELPINFSGHGRRGCIDLIGALGPKKFLCEIKYSKPGKPAPTDAADYAILEALIYFGIVSENHDALHKMGAYRPDGGRFHWADIYDSQLVMVLANKPFWESARLVQKRIQGLQDSIQKELCVEVLLCECSEHFEIDDQGKPVFQTLGPLELESVF